MIDVVFFVVAGCFILKRLLTFLHIFQQEEYDGGRFISWWWRGRAFDMRASSILILCIIFTSLLPPFEMLFWNIFFFALCLIAWREKDPRKTAKKKLAMTARASRVFWTATIIMLPVVAALIYLDTPFYTWLITVQAIPFSLPIANLLLAPIEATTQKKFWDEAHAKLESLKPYTIGITGSFGKTSVKHILGHILSDSAPTLMTPGSVNTPMGIARVVRENLAPHHKYFLCEMGAYGPGSIKRLCELSPPDAGVLITVGQAHYERYKSLDTVAQAKCELPEAVAARGGWSVMGSDTLNFEYTRGFADAHKENVILVGTRGEDEVRIINVLQTSEGLKVELSHQGLEHTVYAPIYGTHQAANIAIAYAVATKLGLTPAQIGLSLKSLPQIRHRLEVIRKASGAIIIDDAFNSNPSGFASALSVLSTLGNKRRKILVTPGMVELGKLHDAEHAQIGMMAARYADMLIVIQPDRIQAMVDGFQAKAPEKKIIKCANFNAAQDWLAQNMRADDVVLIENDLPDLYESKLKI